MSTLSTVGASGASDLAALDEAVRTVADRAQDWAESPPAFRRALLEQILRDTAAAAQGWLADSCAAKGLDPTSPEAGEELISGLLTLVRVVRLLAESLEDIEGFGRPRYPGPVEERPGDRLAVGVFPGSLYDRLVYPKTRAEVWMQPGISRQEVDEEQAWAYRDPQSAKGACLVLAAGNVASLGPRDVLYKLFVEGKTVVLKANPVNDYLVPHWARAMRPLIEQGFLRIVSGGQDAGQHLINHRHIDEVHLTGSDRTHDAIVFGTGEEGARRKAADQRLVDKPVSCELGNVSPVIVVPGRWSPADLLYQARHVATMVVNNAGFNCLTPRVLVTHAGWPQREAFMEALAQTLRTLAVRRPYYPGAEQRRQVFVERHPDAWQLGPEVGGTAPWTLIRDVNPGRTDDVCFTTEAFCGLLAETALPGASPAQFLDGAVEFSNQVLWGTLSATLLVRPTKGSDPELAAAVNRAVANLAYGTIGVNVWHGLSFAIGSTTWGAYPGHPVTDIQSGRGVVANTYMFHRPQKSVLEAPFRMRPEPPWFATNPNQLALAWRLLAFETHPSPARLAALMAAALKK